MKEINLVTTITCKSLQKGLRKDSKNGRIIAEGKGIACDFLQSSNVNKYCKTLVLIADEKFSDSELLEAKKSLSEFVDEMYKFIYENVGEILKDKVETNHKMAKKLIEGLSK